MIILAKVTTTIAGSDGIVYWLYGERAIKLGFVYFYLFIYFIRSNTQQKQHINTITCEQDSPGSNEH